MESKHTKPIVQQLPLTDIMSFLRSDHPERRALAAGMILDRMDWRDPDMEALFSLLLNPYEEVRMEVNRFIGRYAGSWSEELLIDLVSQLMEELQKGLSPEDGETTISPEILSHCANLLQGTLRPMLSRLATIELVIALSKVDEPVLQELAVQAFNQINFTRHPYRGEELFPLLACENPMLRQEARRMLRERFSAFAVDASFVAKLASIEGEEHQVFVTQLLTDRLLWLEPIMPEVITALRSCLTQEEIPEEARDYIREDLLGTLFWSKMAGSSN